MFFRISVLEEIIFYVATWQKYDRVSVPVAKHITFFPCLCNVQYTNLIAYGSAIHVIIFSLPFFDWDFNNRNIFGFKNSGL